MVQDGLGRHLFYLSQNEHSLEQVEGTKLQYMNQLIIILGVMFIKVSITFFLLRIFGLASKRWWRWCLYLVMVTTVVTGLSSIIIILTQCRPLARLWDPRVSGHCWARTNANYGGGKSIPLLIIWNETLGLQ